MIDLADILPSALPAAVAWAEAEAARGIAQGAPLTPEQADDARARWASRSANGSAW